LTNGLTSPNGRNPQGSPKTAPDDRVGAEAEDGDRAGERQPTRGAGEPQPGRPTSEHQPGHRDGERQTGRVAGERQTGRRARDPQARRDALAAATIEIVAEMGIGRTTHRAVAARAGLPLGATTYYFPTLDALITAALQKAADDL